MTLRRNFVVAAPQVAATGYRPPRGGTRGVLWACHGESGKAVGGCASAATLCGAEDRRAHGRAHAVRASTSDSRRLFEHSERSERSEFRRGPCDRGPEGSRPARPTAVHERWRIPARGFASLDIRQATKHARHADPRPAARRPVRAVRARPVADVRRDAAHQHRAGRLHRAGRVRGDRDARRWWRRAPWWLRLLLLPVAFGFGYALQRCGAQRHPGAGSAAVAGRDLRPVDRDPEPAARSLLGRSAFARTRRLQHAQPGRCGGVAVGVLPLAIFGVGAGCAPRRCSALFDRTALGRAFRAVSRRPRDRRADGAGRATRSMRWPPPSPSC